MNKLPKYIVYTLLSLIGAYIVVFVLIHVIFSHSSNFTDCEQHRRFFKSEERTKLSPLCSTDADANDIYSHFIYKGKYYISVWEFKNMAHINLNSISFIDKQDLINASFWGGEVVGVKTGAETTIKYGFDFDTGMQIALDQFSKIEKTIEEKTYKGFYGTANRISLNDGLGKSQLLLDYKSSKEPVLLIVYKEDNSLFIFIVYGDLPFDEKMVSIFNLE